MVKPNTVLKNYLNKLLKKKSKKKKEKLKYELLPSRILSHLFHCVCGSQARSRCRKCTHFFVNDETEAKKIQRDFYFYLLRTSNSSLVEFFAGTSVEECTLNIFYFIKDFVKTNHNQSYGRIFCESANKPFQLC